MAYLIRDSREKPGHGWFWPEDFYFEGTLIKALKTGDYSIEGYENIICIDRKLSVPELAQNLTQARFKREMERMSEFKTAIVLMEFLESDLDAWPSQLSKKQQSFVRTSPKFLRKQIRIFEETYGVSFIYGGVNAKDICYDLLKEVITNEVND